MCHLKTRPLEPALDVEAFVCFGAVQNGLVAANVFRNIIQGLDDAQTEFLALLIFCDGDVFDVADEAEVVDAVGRTN